MNTMTDRFVLDLAPKTAIPLEAARGWSVRVTLGMVWITEEHGTGDHVLRAGEMYRVRHGGRVVIEAFSVARIAVESPTPIALVTAEALTGFVLRLRQGVQRLLRHAWLGWSI